MAIIRWLISNWLVWLPPMVTWTGFLLCRRMNRKVREINDWMNGQFAASYGVVRMAWGNLTCELDVVRVYAETGHLVVVCRKSFIGSFTIPQTSKFNLDWHASDGSHIYAVEGAPWVPGSITVVSGDLTVNVPIKVEGDPCFFETIPPEPKFMKRPEKKLI